MEDYKNSGFGWIGSIPQDWTIGRIQHRYSLQLGKMVEPDAGLSSRNSYPYICAANVKWTGIDTSIQKEMYYSSAERSIYDVMPGDLLVTEGGSVGVSCVYNGEFGDKCYMQNSVIRVRGASSAETLFLRYWLELVVESGYIDVLCNKATISHYTKDKVAKPLFRSSLRKK